MIRLEKLNKYYNKGKSNEIHVINDITVEFADRGMIALFGRSGCGKTTLLNVIGGLDKAQGGSVFVEGQKMSAGMDELRNRYIGYIFQNYCLNMNESCFDNVAAALRLCGMRDEEEIKTRVMKALTAVGMQTFFKRTPNSLSGGQQQRIAIARAIVKNPPVILADEPTGNLDEANTVTIMNILKEISKEHLVLLVTHEANLVDYYCDSVIELNDGQIAGVRNNEGAAGYLAKDKNTIYLGEYEKSEIPGDTVSVDYYGVKPAEPVRFRLINKNGVMYLKVDSPGVHVLDESSEMHLEEGCFEEKVKNKEEGTAVDLSGLTSFEGKNYGKLFSFKDGLKSGYEQITARFKNKKSAKRLRNVMLLFAIVVVFYIAYAGSPIRKMQNLKGEYNRKAVTISFNGEIPEQTARKLANLANAPESAVERSVLLRDYYPDIDRQDFSFEIGSFETYQVSILNGFDSQMEFRANVRPLSDITARQIAGFNELRDEYDIILSKSAADLLLRDPMYTFIDDYEDLIGMSCQNTLLNARRQEETRKAEEKRRAEGKDEDDPDLYYDEETGQFFYFDEDGNMIYSYDGSGKAEAVGRKYFRVAGIVDTDELVVYVDDSFFDSYSPVNLKYFKGEENDKSYRGHYYGCVVYSEDIAKTKRYLSDKYPMAEVLTWEDRCRDEIQEAKTVLYSSLFSILVMLGILSVCMYFIMRSIYMNRMKEFGTYRAIGVSKRNLMFRSFVETGVTATMSVFIGYVLATFAVSYIQKSSSAAAEFFYYPLWMKIFVLIFLYAVCLFSGTLSVRKVLRKTPAEIMAKYDI